MMWYVLLGKGAGIKGDNTKLYFLILHLSIFHLLRRKLKLNLDNLIKIDFMTESDFNALSQSEKETKTYSILRQLVDNYNQMLDEANDEM